MQKGLKDVLQKAFTKPTELFYSLPEDIDNILEFYSKSLEGKVKEIVNNSKSDFTPELVEEVIKNAVEKKSSDIHIEPLEHEVVIRFRIDGLLQEVSKISKDVFETMLNRVKVQANLRIDEHFIPQDGSLRYMDDSVATDLRCSIIPTIHGEKIVLRVLETYIQSLSLGAIGLNEKNEKIISENSKKPFGLILVTGPTGSGKTTTLYALLKTMVRTDVNITTVEDPVEYRIEGINQIQVNAERNLTFARALRSVVRQDPDIILVGEIRDNETAEIAVNAALTGHLVLSTFHANDSASTIPRLLDMGMEPFLLASTIELIVAQRLVRTICHKCKTSYVPDINELEKTYKDSKRYFSDKSINLYKGKGCPLCSNTGYLGRTGIFEILQVTNEIKEIIAKDPTSNDIWEIARKNGVQLTF